MSSRTCCASSRVGTRISAAGSAVLDGSSRSTIGNANPRVLPEPVFERARVSRPDRASSQTIDWIGKGSVMPRASRAATTGSETPSARKPTGTSVTSKGYRADLQLERAVERADQVRHDQELRQGERLAALEVAAGLLDHADPIALQPLVGVQRRPHRLLQLGAGVRRTVAVDVQ